MKTLLALTTAAALLGAQAAAIARDDSPGASKYAPGQQMQKKGSKPGTTGASGYAPGQRMHQKGPVKGTTGASGYAPGHRMQNDSDRKNK